MVAASTAVCLIGADTEVGHAVAAGPVDPKPGAGPITGLPRCPWAGIDPSVVAYHDWAWGVRCRDDRELFERLVGSVVPPG